MAAFRTAFKIALVLFRVFCVLIQIAFLLVVAPVYLMVACFVAFWVGLTLSYVFLPAAWTLALWQSASKLYAHSALFKAATIASFAVLCMPLLTISSAALPEKTRRELDEEADMAIAARQQCERRAKLRNSMRNSHGPPPSWWDL
jgi:hypothetical protein